MIFLLIFSYLRLSWNGDTLVSDSNKSLSGDVKKRGNFTLIPH